MIKMDDKDSSDDSASRREVRHEDREVIGRARLPARVGLSCAGLGWDPRGSRVMGCESIVPLRGPFVGGEANCVAAAGWRLGRSATEIWCPRSYLRLTPNRNMIGPKCYLYET